MPHVSKTIRVICGLGMTISGLAILKLIPPSGHLIHDIALFGAWFTALAGWWRD